ncbi:hypothetical protein KI387_017199, partial [Taxus chinensis]
MEILRSALIFVFVLIYLSSLQVESAPLACNVSTVNSCTGFLYFVSPQDQAGEQVASMFGVSPRDVGSTHEENRVYVVNVTCLCNSNEFFAKAEYIVKTNDTWGSISQAFDGLISADSEKKLSASENLNLKLLCGCLDDVGVMSYEVVAGDTLYGLANRFNTSYNRTIDLNRIENENNITAGQILFLPMVYPENLISQGIGSADRKRAMPKSRTGLIVGVTSGVIFLVAALIIGGFYFRSKSSKQGGKTFKQTESCHGRDLEASKHLQDAKSICCSLPQPFCPCIGKENVKTIFFQKESGSFTAIGFESNKPIIFTYSDILEATDNLHESKKIGHGSYGAVYLGKLMDKAVAIKQMKDTKSKEFLAELKILCRVHHTNLIELIGYSAGGGNLFLVYEYAENGALSDCLHDPLSEDREPLSWTARVQIALDSARGLEYIHEHTKPIYAHRDVKTSNILIDSDFRAKIADFGLVKLLVHSLDDRTATTKVVGTFGYLAPEYVRDGHVSTKNDVYAYGVVLMELIAGKPALSRNTNSNVGEWRSLISFMSSILKDTDITSNLKTVVDKGLLEYPEDIVLE